MKRVAIIDVPKSGGNPVLNFPEGTTTKKRGNRLRISFKNKTVFVTILKSTPTRWISFVVAPKRAFPWLVERLGADVYELTYEFWQSRKVELEALGLVGETIDGEEVLRLPHSICGQSPFIRAPS